MYIGIRQINNRPNFWIGFTKTECEQMFGNKNVFEQHLGASYKKNENLLLIHQNTPGEGRKVGKPLSKSNAQIHAVVRFDAPKLHMANYTVQMQKLTASYTIHLGKLCINFDSLPAVFKRSVAPVAKPNGEDKEPAKRSTATPITQRYKHADLFEACLLVNEVLNRLNDTKLDTQFRLLVGPDGYLSYSATYHPNSPSGRKYKDIQRVVDQEIEKLNYTFTHKHANQ